MPQSPSDFATRCTRSVHRAAQALALAGGLLLAGCAAGPDPALPDIGLAMPARLPSQPAPGLPAPSLERWWERMERPALDRLVTMVAQDNPDLAAAAARYRAAEQDLRGERAGLLPQVSGSNTFDRTVAQGDRSLASSSNLQGSFGVSWEIDLFGGLRAATRAAAADARAAAADFGDQRRALIGSVARSFVDEALARERIALTQGLLESQRQTRRIVEWRVDAGLATGLDREQARQLVLGTEAQLPALEVDRRSAANRLAVLAGRSPGVIDPLLEGGDCIPAPVDAGALAPNEFVRRRPDVRAAEENLVAAMARIGVARAAMMPRLTLSGSLTGSGTGLGALADSASASIGALVDQVLFDGGRNRAKLAAQKARADAAREDYRAALLAALEDVDNAYAALAAARTALESRRGAEDATARSALILRQQYAAGIVDFRDLLDAEQNLLSASDQRVRAEAELARASINLIQALGGDDPLTAPSPSRKAD